ncbi:glycoprotein [Joinjakaka virus]|uniref:Glycoprotein n=1 Tax=Joinjakaka virus TaxID=1272943 RepID=A0A0D3R1Z2_9RHAB|nr:glycoprotein [Joinjakaka virus]AJR28532.1 glycoprotein [Joinjakaka virus]
MILIRWFLWISLSLLLLGINEVDGILWDFRINRLVRNKRKTQKTKLDQIGNGVVIQPIDPKEVHYNIVKPSIQIKNQSHPVIEIDDQKEPELKLEDFDWVSGNEFEGVVNMPVNCLTNWKVINPYAIRCPTFYEHDRYGGGRTVIGTAVHPEEIEHNIIPGFMCQKQTWVTECTEAWYWSTTVKNYVESSPVVEMECLMALAKEKVGTYVDPFFPPAECAWNANSRSSKEFVTLHPHDVRFDFYQYSKVDPLFVGGKCNEKSCPTIHQHVIWIGKNPVPLEGTCNLDRWRQSDIFALETHTSEKKVSDKVTIYLEFIESATYGMRSTKNACWTRFCDVPGIRFNDGEWWGIKSGHNVALDFLPECGKKSLITLHHAVNQDSEFKNRLSLKHYKCTEVLTKLISGSVITPMDISYLISDRPGLQSYYRFSAKQKGNGPVMGGGNNYMIEQKECMYQFVLLESDRFNITKQSDQINVGMTLQGDHIYINLTDFQHTKGNKSNDINRFTMTVNGYLKTGNVLVLPVDEITSESVDNTLYTPIGYHLIEEEEIGNYTTIGDAIEKILILDPRLNRTDIVEETVHFVNNIGKTVSSFFQGTSSLLWWGVTSVFFLVIVLLMRKCGVIDWLLKKKKPKSVERMNKYNSESNRMVDNKTSHGNVNGGFFGNV